VINSGLLTLLLHRVTRWAHRVSQRKINRIYAIDGSTASDFGIPFSVLFSHLSAIAVQCSGGAMNNIGACTAAR